ncbi:MAG: energy-coupling factor transporter ATPase [Ruminococcaceae bacterium]|nr:energy-coupling factor transporter ATPase [Oscillospiraceae bacterium]
MNDIFIHAKDLTYAYKEEDGLKMPVLHGISLDIRRGEYVAVLGHNGSGKSTFAKLLNMILEPDGGELTVAGRDLTSPELTEDDLFALRREVGMVFQNPDNQLVATIVEEDVAFGPENLGVPPAEIRQRVDEALATVGMTAYARHEPHRLSGGQKQRIAIAGVLAMHPSCVILDEATAMLDPAGRREVIETVERMNREAGMTVITITHYMNEAARADRVVVIDDGRILMDGTPREVFAQPEKLMAAGLDVPQCTALVYALDGEGIALKGTPVTTEECADFICRALEDKKNGNRNA